MLVIHGSALTGGGPRDLDIVHTGEWTPGMEQAVREWAAQWGTLPVDIPLDVHRVEPDEAGRIAVPAPCDPDLAAFHVLDGDPDMVRPSVWRDFSSGIRAYGHDPDVFFRRMAAGEFGMRVSLMPTSERPDYGARFGVPWDKYCTGITSLRSAVRTSPSTILEIMERLGGGGELLMRIYRGAEPTRNWMASPNTRGGIVGHEDGWSQAVSLKVSSSGAWSVGGQTFGSADAAAEWLGLA